MFSGDCMIPCLPMKVSLPHKRFHYDTQHKEDLASQNVKCVIKIQYFNSFGTCTYKTHR